MTSAWLLPEHIADVLPSEARRIEELRRKLLDLARSYGFELVIPPMLEHLESLLTGTGRPIPDTSVTAQGGGLVDLGAAASGEISADPVTLAFDHLEIVRTAVERLRAKLDWSDVAFALLHDEFTLHELQGVHEVMEAALVEQVVLDDPVHVSLQGAGVGALDVRGYRILSALRSCP